MFVWCGVFRRIGHCRTISLTIAVSFRPYVCDLKASDASSIYQCYTHVERPFKLEVAQPMVVRMTKTEPTAQC